MTAFMKFFVEAKNTLAFLNDAFDFVRNKNNGGLVVLIDIGKQLIHLQFCGVIYSTEWFIKEKNRWILK